jgi:hypothetical protein
MKRLGIGVLAMGALLGGCAGQGSDFEPLPGDVCAKQHSATTSEGDELVVCDALYEDAPFVHLPKLDQDHVFAGIVGREFVTADGVAFPASASDAEMKRHAVVLYELALDGGKVTSFQPVLQFDEAIFIAPLMGRSFEGMISRGMDQDHWSTETSLPVRVDVDATPVDHPSDATYEARATIANLGTSITGSDGSCMPSLASYGAEAPFAAGASVELKLYRVPSMHDFGDDQLVMLWTVDGNFEGTLMAPGWYRGPIDVVRGTLAATADYDGMGPRGTSQGEPTRIGRYAHERRHHVCPRGERARCRRAHAGRRARQSAVDACRAGRASGVGFRGSRRGRLARGLSREARPARARARARHPTRDTRLARAPLDERARPARRISVARTFCVPERRADHRGQRATLARRARRARGRDFDVVEHGARRPSRARLPHRSTRAWRYRGRAGAPAWRRLKEDCA